jgi:hypothetical protein
VGLSGMGDQDNNGFLRQGEFRRWATGVDQRLDQLMARMYEHTEQLAVLNDRSKRGDEEKTSERQLRHGVIVASVGSAVAFVSEMVHLFWRK